MFYREYVRIWDSGLFPNQSCPPRRTASVICLSSPFDFCSVFHEWVHCLQDEDGNSEILITSWTF